MKIKQKYSEFMFMYMLNFYYNPIEFYFMIFKIDKNISKKRDYLSSLVIVFFLSYNKQCDLEISIL